MIIEILLFLIIVGTGILFLKMMIDGEFTGNEYKKIDGKIWVKHPGSGWELLSEHKKKQKELRENR